MKETNLIYKIASFYFEDNLTQQQIAQKMGISRIKVSRMLQQARNKGIVEISLNKPQQNYTEEEKSIADKWNLNEVILTAQDYSSNEDLLKQLGVSASEYAMRILNGNETVSLAWGSTLSSLVQNLPKVYFPEIKIVQMIGGLGSPEAEVHSSDLVRRLSDKTGGKGRILSAPGVVTSKSVKEGLLEDTYIKETLVLAASSDIAFVGIGTGAPNSILMSQGDILSAVTLKEIKKLGAVGDIALRFFNSSGDFIDHPINDRIIGISSMDIKKIPRVIAIAGGLEKYKAIHGALESGLIDVLITDYKTGIKLLEGN